MSIEERRSWAHFRKGVEAGGPIAAGGGIMWEFMALHGALKGCSIVQEATVLQILDYGENEF